MARKPSFGRVAVDHLRAAYMAGIDLGSKADLIAYLDSTLAGFKRVKHASAAPNWDRQARLENAEHNKLSVPNLVHANGYRRIAVPSPEQRRQGREPRRKDTRTRVLNDRVESIADAAQSDATPNEKAIAPMYDAIASILDAVQALS